MLYFTVSLCDPTTLSHAGKEVSDLFLFFSFSFFSPNLSTTDHQVISSIWIVIFILFTLVAAGEDIRLWLGLGWVGVLGNTNRSRLFTVPFFFWCHVSFRVCFYFSLMCLLLLCLLVLEKYPFGDFKTL